MVPSVGVGSQFVELLGVTPSTPVATILFPDRA